MGAPGSLVPEQRARPVVGEQDDAARRGRRRRRPRRGPRPGAGRAGRTSRWRGAGRPRRTTPPRPGCARAWARPGRARPPASASASRLAHQVPPARSSATASPPTTRRQPSTAMAARTLAGQRLVVRGCVDDHALPGGSEGGTVGLVGQRPAGLPSGHRHGLGDVERREPAHDQPGPHLRGQAVEVRQVRERPVVVGARAQARPPGPTQPLLPRLEHSTVHDHLEVVVLGGLPPAPPAAAETGRHDLGRQVDRAAQQHDRAHQGRPAGPDVADEVVVAGDRHRRLRSGVQRHRAVDARSWSIRVTASTPSSARSAQISPTQDSASAWEANRRSAYSPATSTSAPEASSSRHHHGRSAGDGLPEGRRLVGEVHDSRVRSGLDERRLGDLEDLAATADVDADLGVGGDLRGDEGEPDALLERRREGAAR